MLLLVLQGSTNGEQTKEKKKQTDMFFFFLDTQATIISVCVPEKENDGAIFEGWWYGHYVYFIFLQQQA